MFRRSHVFTKSMRSYLCVAVTCLLLGQFNQARVTADGGKQVKQNAILARVNGEPIYARDVFAGLPNDTFSTAASDAADLKLERLINRTMLRQYLSAKHVKVSEKEVDRGIDVLRKYPPGHGLPMLQVQEPCSVYASQFLHDEGSSG